MGAHAERMKAFERGGDYGKGKLYNYSPAEVEAYERGWSRMMVEIWREKMQKLGTVDTGKLYGSLQELVTTGEVTTIEHKFMRYGLFVAAGVGKGFAHGNPGDLPFMSESKRSQMGNEPGQRYGSRPVGLGLSQRAMRAPKFDHNERGAAMTSGHPRQPRDWFFKKYYYSLRRLNLTEAQFFGRAYQGMMSSFLDELFSGGIRSNRF